MDYRTGRFPIHTLTDSDFTEYAQDRTRVDYISEEDHDINQDSSSYSSNISSAHETSSILREPNIRRQATQTNATLLNNRKGYTSQSEREHAPYPRDEDEVRLPFFNVFSEKEIMLELLNKEEERCLKTLKMVEDVILVSKQNEELKFFNRKLKERAYKR